MPLANNRLIALLGRPEQKSLIDLCERVELVYASEIHQPNTATSHAYFPLAGYVSLISSRPGTPGIEVGMVGSEGMVGTQLVLGLSVDPLLVIVQGAGSALRLPAAVFQQHLAGDSVLQGILTRYVGTLMGQFATAAPCLRFHHIVQRLARWLLITQDRAGTTQFHSTHEFLSYMLGVRRAGVTEAAGELQQLGAIRYERGEVTVLDRGLLETSACSCYAVDRAAYEAAMGKGRGKA